MITPPNNHARMLFTVWGQGKGGKVKIYVGHSPFTEFFAVTKRTVARFLGEDGWRWLDSREIKVFSTGLRELMTRIRSANAARRSRSRADSPAAKRSARARKGWKTRWRMAAMAASKAKKPGQQKPVQRSRNRADSPAAKRSARARKGWKTRRRMATVAARKARSPASGNLL
jgi:hypothetical protein